MAVPGVFASDQHIVGNRRGDFAAAMLQIAPTGTAPLLALTSGMQSEDATDTVVNWFEEVKITGRTKVASGGTGTTIVVEDGSSYIPGVILMVEASGEYILVTNVTGNTLTVVRGIAGTSTVSVGSTDYVVRIGNAHEEGSAMPKAVVNQGHPRLNFTQIFRNAWAVTGTTKAVRFHTGSQVAKSKADCAFFHAEDIERSLIWGRKHITTLNGKPFRLMDGIKAQIAQYGGEQEAQVSSTSLKDFRDFLRRVFANNVKGKPNERIAFCGDLVLQTLNEAAALDGEHKLETSSTEFGLQLNTFISPFGKLKLMTHPLMNENPVWQKELYVLHPGAIKTRYLRRTDIEGYDSNGNRINGKDADEGVYTTEVSIQVMAAQTMGIYTGIDTPSASSGS